MAYEHIFLERQNAQQKLFEQVFKHGQWPDAPLSTLEVESMLCELALADSNNFEVSGAGEREGRVYSELVRRRHFGFAHGAGRSGDLSEAQPKAAGSGILNVAAHRLVREALLLSGYRAKGVLLVPMCTGMTINLLVQAVGAKHVAWMRADQKSVPKALVLAKCRVSVVDGVRCGQEVQCDVAALQAIIQTVDTVISTTSCFAPRAADDVRRISQLCKEHGKLHIVNNAYGIHSARIMRELNDSHDVDYIVSSLDKNFMVPVGSSVVYSAKNDLSLIAKSYAGRASNVGNVDVLITLLEMGKQGWKALQHEREEIYDFFVAELREIPQIEVVTIPSNQISFYFYFKNPNIDCANVAPRLFRRAVSGSKALLRGETMKIGDIELKDFGRGAEYDAPAYITCAAAIGITRADVTAYTMKLRKIIAEIESDLSAKETESLGV